MKTKNLLMSALLVLTIFLAGCSKKNDYVNAIPADADMVASVDIKSLAQKSGLGSDSKRVSSVVTETFRNSISAESMTKIEEMISKPSETGIDFESPLYIFSSPSFKTGAMLLRVTDSGKLTKLFGMMTKEQLCQALDDYDDYSYVVMNGSALWMFSDDALLLAALNGGHSEIEMAKKAASALLSQKADSSIVASAAFNEMKKGKADVNFFAYNTFLPDYISQQIKLRLRNDNINPKDVAAVGGLTFDKGKIELQMKSFTENDEVKKMLKAEQKAFSTIDGDFMSYFPKSTLVYAGLGVNGKKLYSLLQENEELLNAISIIGTETGKSVIESFNGDISLGITGVSMYGTPTFLLYADVKTADLLNALYDGKDFFLSGRESIEKKGKNEYVYKEGSNEIYYGMKKKTLYATNDKLLFDNICKNSKPSIKEDTYVKNISGKCFFAAADVNAIMEIPMLKMAIEYGGAEAQMFQTLASKVDYVEINSNKDGVQTAAITLKDSDTNSLKVIFDFLGQFIGL